MHFLYPQVIKANTVTATLRAINEVLLVITSLFTQYAAPILQIFSH
jgi:hypothetical protein